MTIFFKCYNKRVQIRRKQHLQLEERFLAISRNENAVLFLPPTWKSKSKTINIDRTSEI